MPPRTPKAHKDSVPSASERTALVNKLKARGLTDSEAKAVVKAGKRRHEIAGDLIAWLRDRTKG